MKYLSKFLVALLSLFFLMPQQGFSQLEIGLNYNNGDPQGLMSRYIRRAHGLSLDFMSRLGEKSRFSLGVSLGTSGYGSSQDQQEYVFDDGTSIDADVSINNTLSNVSVISRFELLPQARLFNPYLQAQFGASFFRTNLSISDPREEYTSDCPKPLETDLLSSDVTASFAFGVGTRLNLTNLFGGDSQQDGIFLNLSMQYLLGGNVEYMNQNPPSGNIPNGSEANPVMLRFASEAQPDNIQSYESGYRYRSQLDMLEFKIGFSYIWGM